MFQTNEKHRQSPLFSTLDELPRKMREKLDTSWAGTFRQQVFEKLDERPFAVLYSTEASRPNVPVNVLVGLEILKAGFGWTDEEMYEHFTFDLQVRYALGYVQLSEGYFAIRTVYEFRRRLSEHMQTTGENLLEAAFEQVTDDQIQAFGVRTQELRMDSTQIASHIRQYSRLHLLVEVLQRVQRMLSETDQAKYAELLTSYVKGKSSHYVYGLKNSDYTTHIEAVGKVMAQLVSELAVTYGQEPGYQILTRVFAEHFVWEENEQRAKVPSELSASSLQAPDDPDATFRRKNGEGYRGFVTNITETCHPDNQLQLIIKVHTEPNVADDARMLQDELPALIERTDVETIYTDGGYNSAGVDKILDEHNINHVQTAIRGDKPNPDTLNLVDFQFEIAPERTPVAATCPQGQRFEIQPGRADARFIGRPDGETCLACPLLDICPVRPRSGNRTPALYVEERTIKVTLKRQAILAMPTQGNPRAAVEATVRSVKHPLNQGHLRVRGLFRVACQMIGSAMMVNVRRIQQKVAETPSLLAAIALFWLFSLWKRPKQPPASMKKRSTLFADFHRRKFAVSLVGSHCFNSYPAF